MRKFIYLLIAVFLFLITAQSQGAPPDKFKNKIEMKVAPTSIMVANVIIDSLNYPLKHQQTIIYFAEKSLNVNSIVKKVLSNSSGGMAFLYSFVLYDIHKIAKVKMFYGSAGGLTDNQSYHIA